MRSNSEKKTKFVLRAAIVCYCKHVTVIDILILIQACANLVFFRKTG